MQNDDYIIEEFGKDIWLYLDNDLPSERMDYWNNQIQTRPEIQRVLRVGGNLRLILLVITMM